MSWEGAQWGMIMTFHEKLIFLFASKMHLIVFYTKFPAKQFLFYCSTPSGYRITSIWRYAAVKRLMNIQPVVNHQCFLVKNEHFYWFSSVLEWMYDYFQSLNNSWTNKTNQWWLFRKKPYLEIFFNEKTMARTLFNMI